MSKTKKLSKDSKKYKELDLKQSKLKSALHDNWRLFYKWKQTKTKGRKPKAPVTMVAMENQQKKINKIRSEIGKRPISLIQDFKKILKNT